MTKSNKICDVVVIGAGIAGLICAQQLQQAGLIVVVVEKSRGVGGRFATRRLHDTRADHGVRYLEPYGKRLQQLIDELTNRNILQVWTDTVYELSADGILQPKNDYPRYIASEGMTAVAKFLATGLDIRLNQRVEAIQIKAERDLLSVENNECDSTYQLLLSSPATQTPDKLNARAIVAAIPAPQAVSLLEPLAESGLSPEFINNLRSVEFDPCLSVMVGYPTSKQQDLDQLSPAWKAVICPHDTQIAWIGLDSSKRQEVKQPVLVIQSTPEFAQSYLDIDNLEPAAHQLLSHASKNLIPWLDKPEWLQIHRWRYAFPKQSLQIDYLDTNMLLPLVCCGDWCGGNRIESAINSGFAAAVKINQNLQGEIF
ncbi:amine oxidase [Crinalium epipsammum PCC 9333]|uniref:Amine oxidase n=1 Tax=Crinalium epipsammum PCC 9333 TaxID=1173022 RepID=K9VUF9_9CYAN|nr:FAD-dependent oxidoreductase [Crinalium epipsammum]AFZ11748.1 amine oxidase [Crinalium epipsammum PCC 9333]